MIKRLVQLNSLGLVACQLFLNPYVCSVQKFLVVSSDWLNGGWKRYYIFLSGKGCMFWSLGWMLKYSPREFSNWHQGPLHFLFPPKNARIEWLTPLIFHFKGCFVLIKSSFKISCKPHIIFLMTPPPTCHCCLVYHPLLVTSPRYWALIFCISLAVTSGGRSPLIPCCIP